MICFFGARPVCCQAQRRFMIQLGIAAEKNAITELTVVWPPDSA